MEINAKVGAVGTATTTVDRAKSAAAVGSGLLEVYATPSMAALMEQSACVALEGALPEGWTTVGVMLNLEHTRATRMGAQVEAQATVTMVDGRVVEFEIVASDDRGEIGRATHRRVAVESARFMSKLG
ncbi:MAG: dihydrolipoamide acyltransferase [Rikenellaceae bacterium]|nr:dihydrolipoamide acyltransferase [Rikenellaceae bacterium]